MIEYLMESSLCGAILYVSFLILFRKSRNYHANRIILLFSVLFFLLAPLLHIPYNQSEAFEALGNSAISTTIADISTVSNQTIETTAQLQQGWNGAIPVIIYAIVAAFLFIRLCFNLSTLISEKFVVERRKYNGYKLALINRNSGPFSFFQTIYLNHESFIKGKIDDDLILHELGHTKQLHSIDILFMELVKVFCWFNPFVFLFKNLIKTNHEYLADEFVIRSGSNKIDYSNKLINYTTRNKTLHLASEFNFSLIKNRIIMLSKYDQKSRIAFRLICFISMITTLFVTTAFTGFENTNSNTILEKETGYIYADTIQWSQENQKVYVSGNIKIKHGENNINGKGTFSFLGEVKLLIFDGKPVKTGFTTQVSGYKCEVVSLPAKEAQAKYGSKGKFGAVEITPVK